MEMNPKRKNYRRAALLFLLVLLFYAYFFHFIGRESWNVSSRLNLTYALAEQGTFRIDAYHQNTGDKVFFRGHYYSDKAPGTALAAVPAYLVLKRLGVDSEPSMRYWLTLLVIGLPSAAGAVIFSGLTGIFGGLSPRLRIGTALAYSLGTLAFPFSTVFYGHQAAAVAGLAAFYILARAKRTPRPESSGLLLLSGFLGGYALLSDFPAGIVLVLLGVYAASILKRRAGIFSWLLGAALPVGFLLYYNYSCFGSPFTSSYSLHQTYSHSAGFLGITLPRLEVLWGITFSPYRGLFYQSPVLLFAIPGFYLFFRQSGNRLEGLVCLLAFLGFLFFNAGYEYWDGVGSTGARFMIPALPFLALALAPAARRWPLRFAGLAVISIVFMLAISATEPRAEWRVKNPLFYFNFFLFFRGYLADNLGGLFGLSGWISLAPLLALGAALGAGLWKASPSFPGGKFDRGEVLRAAGLAGMVLLWVAAAGWQEPYLREMDKGESLFRYYRGRGEENWSAIEEHFQLAVEYEPRFMDPYLRLAEIARLRGWPRVALAYYGELAALFPDSPLILLEMALVRDLMGEPAAAEELLLRAVELDPEDPSLWEQLGAFYHYHGRFQEAIDRWEEALRLRPGEGRIIRRLEEARRALGEGEAGSVADD